MDRPQPESWRAPQVGAKLRVMDDLRLGDVVWMDSRKDEVHIRRCRGDQPLPAGAPLFSVALDPGTGRVVFRRIDDAQKWRLPEATRSGIWALTRRASRGAYAIEGPLPGPWKPTSVYRRAVADGSIVPARVVDEGAGTPARRMARIPARLIEPALRTCANRLAADLLARLQGEGGPALVKATRPYPRREALRIYRRKAAKGDRPVVRTEGYRELFAALDAAPAGEVIVHGLTFADTVYLVFTDAARTECLGVLRKRRLTEEP